MIIAYAIFIISMYVPSQNQAVIVEADMSPKFIEDCPHPELLHVSYERNHNRVRMLFNCYTVQPEKGVPNDQSVEK